MCDKNCGGSCDGRKDKEKRVVEMSAESMAEMPMDVREELERIVNGLPEGVRVRVVSSDEMADEAKAELAKEGMIGIPIGGKSDGVQGKRVDVKALRNATGSEDMAGGIAEWLKEGDEEEQKRKRKDIAQHTLAEICRIGEGLEQLEDKGMEPLMGMRPGKKGIDGKEAKINEVIGGEDSEEWSVNTLLKLVARGLLENEIGQE